MKHLARAMAAVSLVYRLHRTRTQQARCADICRKAMGKIETTHANPEPDWSEIKKDWIAGDLSVRTLGNVHGVPHLRIHRRAKRESWPPRLTQLQREEAAKAMLPEKVASEIDPPLNAFARVIGLLRSQRAVIGRLNNEMVFALEDLARVREATEKLRLPRLDEVDTRFNMIKSAALALAKLQPMERRAFGLNDEQEGLSEFDSMSEDDLAAIENTVRKALGG